MVGITPRRNGPDSGGPAALTASLRSATSLNTARARAAMSRPNGVTITVRLVRSIRVRPRMASSSLMLADKVDWVTSEASAARPKWP